MGKVKVRDLRKSIKFLKYYDRMCDRIWLERVERMLEPCPFCGEEAEIHLKYWREGAEYCNVWAAGCHSCEIYFGARQPDEMVRMWNHRAQWNDPELEPFEVVNAVERCRVEPVGMRMCPFCGGSPKLERTRRYRGPVMRDDAAVPYWRIVCPRCGIDQEASEMQMVVRCWNRRLDPNDYPAWDAGRIHLNDDWRWNWPYRDLALREDVEAVRASMRRRP